MSTRQAVSGLLTTAFLAAAPICASAGENVGIASWYGGRHNGLRTSSGEVFDQRAMTAASATLPLGSIVRVTMHGTGSSVVVRVTDRMGARGAIIDLSKGAAQQIGLLGRGRAMVSISDTAEMVTEVAEASEDEAADVFSGAPRGPRHTRRAFR